MDIEFQRFQTMNQAKNSSDNNENSRNRGPRNDISFNSFNHISEKGTLIIEVHDTGIGISKDAIDKLFTPFMQEDETIGQTFGGTGLGLSICHDFVTMMNGKISVESEKGQGSKFKLEIPLQLSNELTLLIEEEDYD